MRLFIAIYPGVETARTLRDCARALRLPDHRLVPVRQIHLTVRFLGSTAPGALASLEDDLDRIGAETPAFRLTVERLITLPRTRARLVAAETDLPPALRGLMEATAALPGEPVRGGDPTPHLTLARFRRGVRSRPIHESIEPVSFDADEMHLVRSDLGPEGATHESVRIAQLRGSHQ